MEESEWKYIVWLDSARKDDVGRLGGKNASLGELISIGVPVPDGFAITAEAFVTFLEKTGIAESVYALLSDADESASLTELEEVSRKISDLMESTPIPAEIAAEIEEAYGRLNGGVGDIPVAVRSSATTEDSAEASFAGQQETYLNVVGSRDLLEKVRKCWSSLFGPRAIFYRSQKHFDHRTVYISVGVQRIVNARSSGVIFTLDPTSGDDSKITIESAWGLGEAVVSGAVTPDLFIVDKSTLTIESSRVAEKRIELVRNPKAGGTIQLTLPVDRARKPALTNEEVTRLAELALKIEKHYGRPQDIEFAIEGDESFKESSIYLLQSRPETYWVERNKIGTESATTTGVESIVVKGYPASPGVHAGRVMVVASTDEAKAAVKEGDILVTRMTRPDWVPYMRLAGAIVTEEGGVTCHAAIVSRELGIPCIVGARGCMAALKTGSIYTADGKSGFVYEGNIEARLSKSEGAQLKPVVQLEAPAPITATRIYVNISMPEIARKVAEETGADGVGLLRAEHMMLSVGKHPRLLIEEGGAERMVEAFAEGVRQVAGAFHPRPVVYRFLDFKPDEFLNMEGGIKYEKDAGHVGPNPMIGYRGCYRYVKEPDIFRLECKAIRKVREEYGLGNVWVMIPFVRTVEEFKVAKRIMEEEGLARNPDLKLWIMVEVPSTVFLMDEFVKEGLDGISFGTNDLTMLILGIDRNDAYVQEVYDERNPAVLRAMSQVIGVCRRNNITTSVCGQAPTNYPEVVEFLVRRGATSISVNPDKVKESRRLVAAIEQRIILDDIRDRNERQT